MLETSEKMRRIALVEVVVPNQVGGYIEFQAEHPKPVTL